MENRVATKTGSPRGTKAPHASEANSLADEGWANLIAAAQNGDASSLDRLLACARPRLLAVAFRIVRDRDDAEDVVQEALVKVCRHITRFEGRSAFSTWMHRIVANAALDCLRRKHARHERPAAGEQEEERAPLPEAIDDETPERLVGRAETGAAVRGAIATLSIVHQQAIELREIDGESYQTIARAARVPVGTVMSRLHHARRKLQAALTTGLDVSAMQAA
jgi:RNA polymerase sigma-70 factor (ECF subfamily)